MCDGNHGEHAVDRLGHLIRARGEAAVLVKVADASAEDINSVGPSVEHEVAEADVVQRRHMSCVDSVHASGRAEHSLKIEAIHDSKSQREVAKKHMHSEETEDGKVAKEAVKRLASEVVCGCLCTLVLLGAEVLVNVRLLNESYRRKQKKGAVSLLFVGFLGGSGTYSRER